MFPLAFTVTGAPALAIIVVILVLLVLGAVTLLRGAKRGVEKVAHRDDATGRGGVAPSDHR